MLRSITPLTAALWVFSAACAPAQKGPAPTSTARPASTSTARPAAAADPETKTDGPAATEDAAASTGYTPCEKEITRKCPDGYVDGCNNQLTLYHVCVKQGAKPGPLCEKEVTTQCFPGEKDACLEDPAVAKFHICFKP
jgi:hypothetical protein